MPEYHCECCKYTTKQKGHYDKHLQTKKHHKISQNIAKFSPDLAKFSPKNEFKCKYCDRTFKHQSSLSKHIKYSCKKNDDEDLKELVRLLNLQLKEQQENSKNQISMMQKQINLLTKKLQIQKITNSNNTTNINNHNTMNNNQVYNIQLLNFNNTDYSHLTDKDYIKCINDVNHCIKSLICKVHFDPAKPENHNIYISNLKNKYVMMYRNNNWDVVDRKKTIDDMYDYNQLAIEEWYDQYKDKYPKIVKSFERYLSNISQDDTLNDVKELITQLLYNKRHIIIKKKISNEDKNEDINMNDIKSILNDTYNDINMK